MKSFLLLLPIMLSLSSISYAQKLQLGLAAALSNATAKQTIAGSIESEPLRIAALGNTFGAQVKYNLHQKFAISSGLHYNITRLSNEFSWQPRFRATVNNTFHQLQLPVVVQYKISNSWSVGLGCVAQYNLATRQSFWFTDANDEPSLTRNSARSLSKMFTIPLRAQAGFELNKHWNLFLNYDLLLGGYFKKTNNNNQIYGNTHQLHFGCGYWL